MPARAGSAPAPRGSEPPRRPRIDSASTSTVTVGRKGRSSSGNPASSPRPPLPPTIVRRPPPASHVRKRRQLLGGELTRVDVLPDQAIERGPGLGTLGQIGDGQLDDRRLGSGRVAEPAQCGDERPRPLGDDTDHELPGIMERERHGPAGDHRLTGDERDLQRAAERRRLGVEGVRLARRRREVDRHGKACSPLGAADQPKLPGERRAVVGEVDPDRHPRASPGVALDQRPGLHRHPRRRARRGGWAGGPDDQGSAGEHDEDGHEGQGGAREPDARAPGVRHGTPLWTRPAGGLPSRRRAPPESCVPVSSKGSSAAARYTLGHPAAHRAAQARRTAVPVPQEVACPRSARSVRCATTPRRCPISRRVVAPPYDVISPARRMELAARDPRNVVAIDLPVDAGAADPDEKYRQAARTFAAWRSDGTLSKDRQPSLYVYEQEFTVPGTSLRRAQRGFYRAPAPRGIRAGRRRAPARADAGRPQGGPVQAHARGGRQLLGRDGPLRRRHRGRAPSPRRSDRSRRPWPT